MKKGITSKVQLLVIAYIGFISLGLPDPLIGVAWPSVRDEFRLPQSSVSLIFFGVGASYFLSSFFTGRLLSLVSIGSLLAGSSLLVALSGFGYGLAPVWSLFAVFSLVHGLGSGAIDAGLNHYVAHHFSARHMNWLHSFYSLGAMLGPLSMTAAISWKNSWRSGYLFVGTVLIFLSLLFFATRSKWNEPNGSTDEVPEPSEAGVSVRAALRVPLVWLQIAIFFVYTGLEVAVGQWSFTVLTESRHLSNELAGSWVTLYWGSILAGRILFGFVAENIGLDRLLRMSTFAAVAGTSLFSLNLSPMLTAFALALTGFGLAAVFPCLMTRTAQRLGKGLAAQAIGFQVSGAMLGAAALPSLCGFLSQWSGLESIPQAVLGMAVVLMLLHEGLLFAGKTGGAATIRERPEQA